MKKKLLAAILAATMIFSLTACSGKPDASEETPVEDVSGIIEEPASLENTPSAAKYLAFMSGDERLYGDLSKVPGYYDFDKNIEVPLMEAGYDYDILDFLNRIVECGREDVELTGINSVKYALADCGDDGEPELLVYLSASAQYGEGYSHQYLIKNIDDKLQLLYRFENFSRSMNYLANTKGLVYYGGSSGAASWYDSYYYINAEGEKSFLYSADFEFGMGKYFGGLGGIFEVCEKYADEIDDMWCLTGYRFKEADPDEPYEQTLAETYFTTDAEDEELMEKIFDEAGTTQYSMDDINGMISEKAAQAGCSEDNLELREDPLWVDLDISTFPLPKGLGY